MRHVPDMTDEYDIEEVARLNAEQWQLDLLHLNPGYISWGPDEDYMWVKGEGWNSAIEIASWAEHWHIDDMNEVVNFYFEVERESTECETCNQTGYHPDAMWVSESFYSHSSPFCSPTPDSRMARDIMARFSSYSSRFGDQTATYPSEELLAKYGPEFRAFCEEMQMEGHWDDRITEDEAKALLDAGRGFRGPRTAEEWNKAQKTGKGLDTHDGINRGILVEARCKRFGLPLFCPACEGHGYVYTTDHAEVNLVLWVIHPRKGASRGVRIHNIQQEQLPEVFAYLKGAAERNAERFEKVIEQVK